MTGLFVDTSGWGHLVDPTQAFPRPKAITFIESLKVSPYVEIAHVDETLDAQAWLMLKSRQDKQWSLVDCASFVMMQQRGLMEALTTDHHFEQAGLARLLKP